MWFYGVSLGEWFILVVIVVEVGFMEVGVLYYFGLMDELFVVIFEVCDVYVVDVGGFIDFDYVWVYLV